MIVKLALPKYVVTLPIAKRKVEMRPFTVREEKILLLAQEESSIDSMMIAIDQVLKACTFDKESIDSMNKVDAEYLYVQIRNKSMGEAVNIKGICLACKEKTQIEMNYESVVVNNADIKIEPVKILDDVWVILKLPTMRDSFKISEMNSVDVIAYALDTIIEGEDSKLASDYTIEERIEFVESMTSAQVDMFTPFFEKFPTMTIDINYNCVKCGHANHIHIEGVENFFQ